MMTRVAQPSTPPPHGRASGESGSSPSRPFMWGIREPNPLAPDRAGPPPHGAEEPPWQEPQAFPGSFVGSGTCSCTSQAWRWGGLWGPTGPAPDADQAAPPRGRQGSSNLSPRPEPQPSFAVLKGGSDTWPYCAQIQSQKLRGGAGRGRCVGRARGEGRAGGTQVVHTHLDLATLANTARTFVIQRASFLFLTSR